MEKKKVSWITIILSTLSALIIAFFTTLTQVTLTSDAEAKGRVSAHILDEKQDFINVCEEIMVSYEAWQEIIYLVQMSGSDFLDRESVLDSIGYRYIDWSNHSVRTRNRMLLFAGSKMAESTMILYKKMNQEFINMKLSKNKSFEELKHSMDEVAIFYYENWLTNAKKVLSGYNHGERINQFTGKNEIKYDDYRDGAQVFHLLMNTK